MADKGRNGRAVECGGLENRCPVSTGPGVRIPLSPQNKTLPYAFRRTGFLFLANSSNPESNAKQGSNNKRCSRYYRILEFNPVINFVEILQFNCGREEPVLPTSMYSVAVEIIICVFRKLMPVFSKTKNWSYSQVDTTFLPFIL